MLGAEALATTLGELGHHFPPPPAFPRMLQQSWCQEPRAIWKRSWTAVRDLLETKAQHFSGARALPEAPAHPQWGQLTSGQVGVRPQERSRHLL